ncbi:FAD-dependent oxidoreductase [Mycobacterium sp. Root265]|uniref:FAD-dependent oxidoreductase n=1 Tax=Mycobacterium sp. Root265 TaxID=1736504 RepID=UPI0007101C96|nr:FAD-dependent oxidoreductase [Mycobacterium sp. Root265]KRD20760.1 FAD-dependent oxidoreductase [Mycobacterium sp. Root265]
MRILVVGAGPSGLYCALALARRGHDIDLVDREPGPPPRGLWRRRGVMQLHHAHTFRGPVVDVLHAEMPCVLDDLAARRAEVAYDGDGRAIALLCRRATFDSVLREHAQRTPRVTVRTGHVTCGRTGLLIDGVPNPSDLVIDATGRSGRLTGRPPRSGTVVDCGAVYVTRQYRLRGAGLPPMNSPIGLSLSMDGYIAIAFVHDARTFSVTIIHDGSDPRLRELRDVAVFESVIGAIPQLCEWTAAGRSDAITPVLAGGRLYNGYRGQLDDAGRPYVSGVISVGDAVCTTTPLAGRGVALALWQARELVDRIGGNNLSPNEIEQLTADFDSWCEVVVKPWFDDQVYADGHRLRRWAGEDVDLSTPLPSDVISAAAERDPRLAALIAPYHRMDVPPGGLAAAEPLARAVYATGWRPGFPHGPSRDELAALCRSLTAQIA